MFEKTTYKPLSLLSFYVTLDCDKYCRMCCMKAKKNGENMPFNTLETSLKKLSAVLTAGTFVGFSGGEPFLYSDSGRDLADVVELFIDNGYKNIDIQTSGWECGDSNYDNIFLRLKRLIPRCNMTINTSFNLYQKMGIEDRLTNLLPLLWDIGITPDVHMVVDFSNIGQSFQRFYTLAMSLELKSDVSFTDILTGLRSLNPDVVFQRIEFYGDRGKLVLGASALQRVGRGRTIDAKTVKSIGLCDYLKGKENSLAIYPNGEIKPCRIPQSINMASVGNILTNNLQEIINKKESLKYDILQHIADMPENLSICDRCVQFEYAETTHLLTMSGEYVH